MPSPIRMTAIAVAISTTFSAHAAVSDDDAIVVTANRFATADADATFATEIHTRRQIEQSGVTSLFDYLSQHSSVHVAPSFGNREAPRLDMRGYGLESGHQNIVVTVDGMRLNSIDLATPLLGGVALDDIERIEITKGSGAVVNGDGAMAGTIQIHTRKSGQSSASAYAGNYGSIGGAAHASLQKEGLTLGASATRNQSGGTGKPDPNGHRNSAMTDTWKMRAEFAPSAATLLRAEVGEAHVDTRYVNALTQAQFDADPAQSNGAAYTHQLLDSESWQVGGDLWIGDRLRITADHQLEDRHSEFLAPFTFTADYEHASSDLAVRFDNGNTQAAVGVQLLNGDRVGAADTTSKDNTAWFVQGQQRYGNLAISLGGRSEKVEYSYRPAAGAGTAAAYRLHAWDAGLNYRFADDLSAFVNHGVAFQAPDIDRFFTFAGAFNAFISPARARTTTFGIHHTTAANRLKVTVFHSELENEIYLVPGVFTNTNIDESHKYGAEVQDMWKISDALTASLNYAYTRAVIDRENENGGAFTGKELPGVPRHAASVGASYQLSPRATLSVNHSWRSSSFAFNDLENDNVQRQRAYRSTNLSYRNRIKDDLDVFAAVDNLFEASNGLWVDDDAVYPVSFVRTWRVGMKARF